MNIYSIYRITNLANNKIYIGWTSRSPQDRFKEHQKTYSSKTQVRSLISYAIEKYGIDNFNFEILYQSQDYEYSRIIETNFIEENNSLVEDLGGWGYNIDKGGLGHKRSSTTIEKHRQKLLGTKQTKEHKQKIADAVRGERNGMYGKNGELHPLYGKKHTDESNRKNSLSRLEGIKAKKANGTYVKPNTVSVESIAKMKATKLANRCKSTKYDSIIIKEPNGTIITLKNGDYIQYFKEKFLNNFISKSLKMPGIKIKGYELLDYTVRST
jgi:group I intron endonuclease